MVGVGVETGVGVGGIVVGVTVGAETMSASLLEVGVSIISG